MKQSDDDKLKREEELKQLLESLNYTIVGTYEKQKGFGFVVPDGKRFKFDVFVEEKNSHRAPNNSRVAVRIVKMPKKEGKNPEGIILEVLGDKNDLNVEVISVVKNFGIPYEFENVVLNEAKSVSKILPHNTEKHQEKDLTNLFTVTIDGEDAKDLDDAISLEKNKLYVHIADVSRYVTENSSLDKTAIDRGTSVYLLDRVIPMLPKELSNGSCSLNANEERFALTVEMDFDNDGNIIKHDIYESIIKVNMRMSYTGVHAALNNLTLENGENLNDYLQYKDFINDIYDLSKKIRHNRENRGSIDFDFPETKIVVDEDLKPIGVSAYERYEAHKIIEDFMLSANETVAEHFCKKEIPFLYRVHEEPDKEKIENLKFFISKLGFNLISKHDKLKPIDVQKLLNRIKNEKEAKTIEKLTLRAMQQARYTDSNLGHFALASEYYCHFTSPIRRYPDLQIHRIIKEVLHNTFSDKRKHHYEKILHNVGMKTSICERRAIDCERDLERLKECEFMEQFIGKEFEGIVSGLTNYGIYVELENTIEGMIALRDLKDDFYIFDEDKLEIYGERTGKRFMFGQELKIRVINSSKQMRIIDFELVQ